MVYFMIWLVYFLFTKLYWTNTHILFYVIAYLLQTAAVILPLVESSTFKDPNTNCNALYVNVLGLLGEFKIPLNKYQT